MQRDHIRDVISELRKIDKPYKRIMIAGGGNIAEQLASSIEDKFQIKLIEINERRCEALAEKLNYATVLHGDASDQDMLLDEEIGETDVFLVLTNNDEANIMSSMLAKRMIASRRCRSPGSDCAWRSKVVGTALIPGWIRFLLGIRCFRYLE